MKRYKINLSKQIKTAKNSPNYFSVYVGRDKRVMKGLRNVLILEAYQGNSNDSLSPSELGRYKTNVNGSVEIPKSLIKLVTHDENGSIKYSMISAIDDKARKILVPWLDNRGNF